MTGPPAEEVEAGAGPTHVEGSVPVTDTVSGRELGDGVGAWMGVAAALGEPADVGLATLDGLWVASERAVATGFAGPHDARTNTSVATPPIGQRCILMAPFCA
jgi:hypothetical protein